MLYLKSRYLLAISLYIGITTHVFADGQSVPINYDNLSFIEEPMAIKVGPATINANGLVDQSIQYDTSTKNDSYNTRVNGDISIETELPNSWQIGTRYVGNYNRLENNNNNKEYQDNVAVFISDEWGTVSGGNVTGSVRELTRRTRGFGNANLQNDGFIGALDETGAFYVVRYNSHRIAVTADQEGRAEVGWVFERPVKTSNYFVSARLRKGDASESNRMLTGEDTYGGTIVGQYTYASTLISAEVGHERVEGNSTNNHTFGSAGILYKYGAYRVSAEGGVSHFDNDTEYKYALGSRIDIARGASINLGINYLHNDTDENTTAIISTRYEF